MSSLFGVELPTPVNFVIAFVFVLLLIGAAAWLVRRFGATRLDAAARGRQPRLAVIDSAAVDGRRKLVIIRRDNVEHLLMIGGPSDVVVETNIVRAAGPAATRPARATATASMRRARCRCPTPTVAVAAGAGVDLDPAGARHARAAPDRRRSPSNGSRRPSRAAMAPPPPSLRASAPAARHARRPRRPTWRPAAAASRPAIPARRRRRPPAAAPPIAPSADQSLAEMAQRLEAALRRPAPAKMAVEGGTSRATFGTESKATRSDPMASPSVAPKAAVPTQAATRRQASKKRWQACSAVPGRRDGTRVRRLRPSHDGGGDSASPRSQSRARSRHQHQLRPGHRRDRARDPIDRAAHGAVAGAVDPGHDDLVHAHRRGAVAVAHRARHRDRAAQRGDRVARACSSPPS